MAGVRYYEGYCILTVEEVRPSDRHRQRNALVMQNQCDCCKSAYILEKYFSAVQLDLRILKEL